MRGQRRSDRVPNDIDLMEVDKPLELYSGNFSHHLSRYTKSLPLAGFREL